MTRMGPCGREFDRFVPSPDGMKIRLASSGVTFNNPPMRHRMAAAPGRHDRDFFAVYGVAGERSVDGA